MFVLAAEGAVAWGYALPMTLLGPLGGSLGDMVSGRLNRSALRAIVI